MHKEQVKSIIEQCRDLLERNGPQNEYSQCLNSLGELLRATGTDEQLRETLALDYHLLDTCVDIMSNSLLVEFESAEEEELYIRLLRGVNLLTRNLVASATSTIDLPLLLLNLQHFVAKTSKSNKFFIQGLASYLEIMANMSIKYGDTFTCNINLVSDTFLPSTLDIIEANSVLSTPFLIICDGLFRKSENVSALLKDEFHEPLRSFLMSQSLSLLEDNAVGPNEETLISLLENMISNESFQKWLMHQSSSSRLDEILKLAQLVATQNDDWDNRRCLGIIGWAFELLKEWSPAAIELLISSPCDLIRLGNLHRRIVIVLDIIADLSKFHTAKQFLEHYNALDVMLPLLRAAHENTVARTWKEKPTGADGEKKRFPMVKSLIIEILAFVCHQSVKSQDKVRELHGLEIVLSSCNIDEDNPYIKERSILCLRFLLDNNKANQDFVAQLEAKQVVDDKALQEAGYEVEMSDGKVKLRKASNVQSPKSH